MRPEQRLVDLFETLPIQSISGSDYKPAFDFGSYEDLLLHLNHKDKEGGKRYPIVWLETPVPWIGTKLKTAKVKLVLATLSNAKISNRERLKLTFEPTLEPLLNNVKKALNHSGFTRILETDKNVETDFFKFEFDGDNAVSDIWDAIKFECTLEMSDCKQRNINY